MYNLQNYSTETPVKKSPSTCTSITVTLFVILIILVIFVSDVQGESICTETHTLSPYVPGVRIEIASGNKKSSLGNAVKSALSKPANIS